MEGSMTHPTPLMLQLDEETRSTAALPLTVSTSYLLSELNDKTYRDSYVAAQIRIGLPFQIKALRTARDWSQGELAHRAGMAQPRISEIEKPGERSLNIETLLRLASAFDCAVQVSFVPFSQLVMASESFDPGAFSVPTFQQELGSGAFSRSPVQNFQIYFGNVSYTEEVIACPNELVAYRSNCDFNLVAFSYSPQSPISLEITP